jgi:membrane protease YdiL (CAAX protease family)
MKLDLLTKRWPILASVAVILIVTVLTEAPIQSLRDLLAPATGRVNGDLLTDFVLSLVGIALLLLAAPALGLRGRLGLGRPRPWRSVLLGWPLALLALLVSSEYLLGEVGLVLAPALLAIRVGLHLFIGFFEELLFRGYVQGFLTRRWGHSYRGILLCMLLTNAIFGVAHLLNLVMGRAEALYAVSNVVYAFAFGVFFSALYVRTGSVWPGSILHGFFNFMSSLDAFVPGAPPQSEMVKSTTPEAVVVSLVLILPLLLIGLFFLRRSKVEVPVDVREEGQVLEAASTIA